MQHVIEKEIDGFVFQITKVEASKALKMFSKVTKIINKGVGAFKKNADTELDGIQGIVVISDILAGLDESDYDTMDAWIKDYCAVRLGPNLIVEGGRAGDFAPLKNTVVYETVFRGNMGLHIKIIKEFLSTNFLESLRSLMQSGL